VRLAAGCSTHPNLFRLDFSLDADWHTRCPEKAGIAFLARGHILPSAIRFSVLILVEGKLRERRKHIPLWHLPCLDFYVPTLAGLRGRAHADSNSAGASGIQCMAREISHELRNQGGLELGRRIPLTSGFFSG